MIEEVRRGNLPELCSRRDQARGRELTLTTRTQYGPLGQQLRLHPVTGDTPIVVDVVFLPALLDHAFSTCRPFREFMCETHKHTPSSVDSPWELVAYGDEVEPGLELSARHPRKAWYIYVSFLQFGSVALSNEDAWFTLAVPLTTTVHNIAAGFSQLMGRIIESIFRGPHRPDTAGITFMAGGEKLSLFFKHGGFFMDGLAFKCLWCTKGDAGLRCCMKCLNMYTEKSDLIQEDGADGLVCTSWALDDLVFATDEQTYSTVTRLAARKETEDPGVFAVREQIAGFNHSPHSILLMPSLREVVLPVTHTLIDVSHALHSSGVCNTVVFLLLDSVYRAGNVEIFTTLHTFVAQWRWPAAYERKGLVEMFSPNRVVAWRKAGHLKCSAMELISILPVLHTYVVKHLAGKICVPQCDAFIAMMDVHEAFDGRRHGRVTTEYTYQRVRTFLRLCVAAGWTGRMHAKFHWLIHLARQIILSTLSLERKHKTGKRYAKDKLNLTSYERSSLADSTAQHLHELDKPSTFNFEVGLIEPHPAPPKLKAFLNRELELSDERAPTLYESGSVSRICSTERCRRGDVVLIQNGGQTCAGVVWLHAAVNGVPLTLLSMWETRLGFDARSGSAKWEEVEQPELWETDRLLCTCTYRKYTDGVVTLIPPEHRHRFR